MKGCSWQKEDGELQISLYLVTMFTEMTQLHTATLTEVDSIIRGAAVYKCTIYEEDERFP